jgi:hypothetical protein
MFLGYVGGPLWFLADKGCGEIAIQMPGHIGLERTYWLPGEFTTEALVQRGSTKTETGPRSD